MLFHWEANRNSNGFSSVFIRSAISSFHNARPASCYQGVTWAFLCNASCQGASLVVKLVAFVKASRAVESNRFWVCLHFAHALLELFVDAANAHACSVRTAYLNTPLFNVLRCEVSVGNIVGYLHAGLDVFIVHSRNIIP